MKVLYGNITLTLLGTTVLNLAEYRRVKEHLKYVNIFTDLREKIRLRLEELLRRDDLGIDLMPLERRASLSYLAKEVEKVPPGHPVELFDRDKRPSEGNFL